MAAPKRSPTRPRVAGIVGSADQLTWHPPNKSQAEATISKVSVAQPVSFDGETVKKLVDEALASVRRGSTHAQLISREKNPLMIERKEALLLTLTYNFYGQSYKLARSYF